jgi:hypothetical protein
VKVIKVEEFSEARPSMLTNPLHLSERAFPSKFFQGLHDMKPWALQCHVDTGKESPFSSFVHRSQSYAPDLTIVNLAGFNNLLFDVTPFKVMSQRAGSKSTEVFGSGSF